MTTLSTDLVVIIATYSTPGLTFDLLSFDPDTASWLYRDSHWKNKTYYESRGLVVDANLIALPVTWYGYYLIKNRTFYGRPVLFDKDNHQGAVDWGIDRCLYYYGATLFDLFQLPDLSIAGFEYLAVRDTRECFKHPFNQRIYEIGVYSGTYPRVAQLVSATTVPIVTERGDVYLPGSGGIKPVLIGCNVVSVIAQEDEYTVLDRDGSVAIGFRRSMVPIPLPIPVVVELIAPIGYGWSRDFVKVITSAGQYLEYTPDTGNMIRDYDSIRLSDGITNKLQPINPLVDTRGVRVFRELGYGGYIDTTRSAFKISSYTRVTFAAALQTRHIPHKLSPRTGNPRLTKYEDGNAGSVVTGVGLLEGSRGKTQAGFRVADNEIVLLLDA